MKMGCKQSKERKGLFTQHKQILQNNNKVCLRAEDDPQGPDGPSPVPNQTNELPSADSQDRPQSSRTRHSPPVSRPNSEYNNYLEGLGSIEEVWQDRGRWAEFRLYLANINEGNDSDDRPVLTDRYAIFVELYAALNAADRNGEPVSNKMQLFNNIHQHQEQFFGRYRCLKCIDAGKRSQVMKDIKRVANNELEPSAAVFATVYSRVVDKLSELLGNYQNSLIEKTQIAEHR